YRPSREASARRFGARRPGCRLRPLLVDGLYRYLERSPVGQRAMARQFFGRDLDRWREPGFGHRPRWSSAAALRRLFAPELRATLGDPAAALLARLAPELEALAPLAQDQLIEISTLLSSYILSSQGDRMLMANSVEGRFPFLDVGVAALAAALPAEHKLHVLDEKHVLKRAAHDLVPAAIARRPKQPYRAPDAMGFVGPSAPGWVAEALSPTEVARAGVFDPAAVAQLWAKCRGHQGPFSNADNMALVGVLSTQLLHAELIATQPTRPPATAFDTVIDRLAS